MYAKLLPVRSVTTSVGKGNHSCRYHSWYGSDGRDRRWTCNTHWIWDLSVWREPWIFLLSIQKYWYLYTQGGTGGKWSFRSVSACTQRHPTATGRSGDESRSIYGDPGCVRISERTGFSFADPGICWVDCRRDPGAERFFIHYGWSASEWGLQRKRDKRFITETDTKHADRWKWRSQSAAHERKWKPCKQRVWNLRIIPDKGSDFKKSKKNKWSHDPYAGGVQGKVLQWYCQ